MNHGSQLMCNLFQFIDCIHEYVIRVLGTLHQQKAFHSIPRPSLGVILERETVLFDIFCLDLFRTAHVSQ